MARKNFIFILVFNYLEMMLSLSLSNDDAFCFKIISIKFHQKKNFNKIVVLLIIIRIIYLLQK